MRWFAQRATVLLPLIAIAIALWVFLLSDPRSCASTSARARSRTRSPTSRATRCRATAASPRARRSTSASRPATRPSSTSPARTTRARSIGLLQQFDVFEDQQGERPARTTEYILVAQNALGLETNLDQTVTVDPPPKVELFAASARHIPREGEPVTLSWKFGGTPEVDAPSSPRPRVPRESAGPGRAAAPARLRPRPDRQGAHPLLRPRQRRAASTARPPPRRTTCSRPGTSTG